jgi:hypothetical protein
MDGPLSSMPNESELHGWEEIAQRLSVTVRTAQTYEKHYGLPVHRGPGAKGRVWAAAPEIDAWKRGRDKGNTGEGGNTRHEFAKSNGSDTFSGPADAPETPRTGGIVLSRKVMPATAVTLLAIAALGIAALKPLLSRPRGVPATLTTAASTLIVRDAQDRELWRHVFPRILAKDAYDVKDGRTRTWTMGDVDDDGETEVIVADKPLLTSSGAVFGELLCFSQDGRRIKWRFNPGARVVTDNSNQTYYPPYWISNVRIVPGRKRGEGRVIVSSNHYLEAPDQVAVLDGGGRLVGEYWHPGHLLRMDFADLDHDGKFEVLLGGVNNGQHAATLIAFDPDHVSGTSTGLADPRFGLRGFPPGTEKAIVLFNRSCVIRSGPAMEPYNRVGQLTVTPDRITVAVVESISEGDRRWILYDLDYGLRVVSAEASLMFQRAHSELERAGVLNHFLLPGDFREFISDVVVVRGLTPQNLSAVSRSTP